MSLLGRLLVEADDHEVTRLEGIVERSHGDEAISSESRFDGDEFECAVVVPLDTGGAVGRKGKGTDGDRQDAAAGRFDRNGHANRSADQVRGRRVDEEFEVNVETVDAVGPGRGGDAADHAGGVDAEVWLINYDCHAGSGKRGFLQAERPVDGDEGVSDGEKRADRLVGARQYF